MNRKQRRADFKQGRQAPQAMQQAAAALFASAMQHAKTGRLNEVVNSFRKAVKISPGLAAAHYNLGKALGEQGCVDEAVSCFRKTIELAPEMAEAHSNLGAALKQLGRFDEALANCQQAIALAPKFPLGHFNLGTVLEELRRLDEAAASYRSAIVLRPAFPEAHLNLAMTLLARGEMTPGWVAHEWRWRTPQMAGERRNFLQPLWQGEAAAGQTILIHAEQGFGDTIQFCRYAPLVAAQGLRVVLEVQKPLARLLSGLPGIAVVVGRGEAQPDFDMQCPMLSLPLALGTTIETIPGATPYLYAGEAEAAAWRLRMGEGLRVGLAWAGNASRHSPALVAVDKKRSVDLEKLAPLFEVSGPRFFSLQKDTRTLGAFPIIDMMAEVEDFAATAALIENLDLVISVDTAVAHLAAALGKPVWLLNRFDSCWRWLAGRRDSPWYPTLRVYQQPKPGDWEAVIAEVAKDLRGLVNS